MVFLVNKFLGRGISCRYIFGSWWLVVGRGGLWWVVCCFRNDLQSKSQISLSTASLSAYGIGVDLQNTGRAFFCNLMLIG